MPKHAAVKAPVPVEHKVIQPTAWSGLLGVVLAVLNGLAAGPGILDALAVPKVYQSLILLAIPPLVTWVSGFVAPHTDRPDLVPATAAPEPQPEAAAAVPPPAPGMFQTVTTETRTEPAPPEQGNSEQLPPAAAVCGH